MLENSYLFIFLAATIVSVFAFLSIAVWASTRAQERQARDRFALLKTLAENPNQNAALVLDMLREQEDERLARKAHNEQRGRTFGGLTLIAVGSGLAIMLASIGDTEKPVWTVGLIPLLIGCVSVASGLYGRRSIPRVQKEIR